MLTGLTFLLLFQLIGEGVSALFTLPIPGSVIGMVLLLVFLAVRGNVPDAIDTAGKHILQHIGLLFVPVGAGVSMYTGFVAEQWPVILIASVTSTALTLLSTAILFLMLRKDK